MLDVAFRPDRSRRDPLYRQLAEYLRELVASRRLVPGEKLPPTRELAAALRLSRNTVNQAYQSLVDGGVVVSHVGQGTFVASRAAARGESEPAEPAGRGFAWDGLLSRRGASLSLPASLRQRPPASPRFDFLGGRVDPKHLPLRELRRAYTRAISAHLPGLANQIDPFGWEPLREEIARMLVGRGIRCGSGDVLITSGAQQALELVTRVLVDEGDAVALEQPGYFGIALCMREAGAQMIGIDVDAEGLRVDQLARIARRRRLKLVFTTPSAHSPTGVTLSDARRRALLELADDAQLPVLEDDYDSEFRYGNPPLPALKTMDPAGQVIYVGTFSKALFPGLRLGYVVAARPLLSRMAVARFGTDMCSDTLAQAAVTELLATGAFERHVRRLRKLYAERREVLLASLAASMPEGVAWIPPAGGHAVWVTLPPEVDSEAVAIDAHAAGIAATRGSAAYLDDRGRDCLALAFVSIGSEQIAEGVGELGKIVARHRALRKSA